MSIRQQTVNTSVPVSQLYRKLEIVGKGAYGAVYRGVHVSTGQVVALKIIDLDTPDDDVADIQREVALLSQLRAENNNITKYYGCWLEGPKVWIVMDFASGGSVRTLMKALPNGIMEERWIVVIVRELLIALVYLHKSNVIHRDIKAANILVQSTGKVLLCDFGVSALLSTSNAKRTTFIGTPHYMAPEVLTSSAYDSKADIWSLGITLYEMATGAQPLAEIPQVQAISLIPKVKPPKLAEHQGSKEMRDFLGYCLRELPTDRQSAEELSKAKWIKNSSKISVSVLKNLLLRYDQWAQAGGVRQSLAEPAPWEVGDAGMEPEDTPDRSSWEFDTIRARHSVIQPLEEQDSYDNPPPPPPRQLPESLRVLFDDGSFQPSSSEPEFLHKLSASPEASTLQTSVSSTSLPDVASEESGDATARIPRHRARFHRSLKSHQQGPPPADGKPDEHVKSDTEGLARDHDVVAPMISHSDSETHGHSRPGRPPSMHPDDPLVTIRKNPNPLEFRFPRTDNREPIVNPKSTASGSSISVHAHPSAHTITASLDSSRNIPSKYLPPSHNPRPSAGSLANQISRKPSLQRQMSLAVMENLQEHRLPIQETTLEPFVNDTSTAKDNFVIGSQPKYLLKDALRIPLLPVDSVHSPDILPPSPSVNTPLPSRHIPITAARGTAALSPLIPSPLASERLVLSDLHLPVQSNVSPSPSPYPSQCLPVISPLDFSSLLRSREDTHNQLARTVEDLAICLQVVERGLDAMLKTAFDGIIEEGFEEPDYSPSAEGE